MNLQPLKFLQPVDYFFIMNEIYFCTTPSEDDFNML